MTQASTTFDIAIAGGSHTGLAMALALVQLAGPEIRVALIERTPLERSAASADPRAFAMAAASRHLLMALGAWDAVALGAQPVHAIDITDSSLGNAVRPVLLSYDNRAQAAGGGPATHIVEAEPLRQALLDRVCASPSITVLARAEIRGQHVSPAGIVLGLTDGTGSGEIKARLLIAADGARSSVREAAGIKVRRSAPAQVAIVATVRHERPHQGRAVQHFLPGGPFAMLPLTGNRTCVTWSEEAERGRAIMAMDDPAFLAELEQRFGFKLGALSLEGPRALWPLELQAARSMIAPRVALAGDAARTVHPIAGQGLNLAFRDVAALAEVVTDAMRLGLDPADAMALERYEQWRRFDSTISAGTFDTLNTLFSNDQPALRMIRDAGLGIVDRLPGLKQLFVAEAAGLTGEVPRLLRTPTAAAAPAV